MDSKHRLFKQIFIVVVYFVIFFGLGTGIYFLVRPTPAPPQPPAPTIFPIESIWAQSFISGPGVYSVAAKIRNPNTNFGASSFDYTFYLYDTNGDLLITKAGESFIWPGESKYIIEGGVNLAKAPVKIVLQIRDPAWHEIKNFGGVDLILRNISYQKEKLDLGKFFSVNFTATNNTSYDLNKVFISAVVFDNRDRPIAVNFTIFDNLKSKEHRSYSLPWFSAFVGNPSRVDLNVSTNLWERPELLGQ